MIVFGEIMRSTNYADNIKAVESVQFMEYAKMDNLFLAIKVMFWRERNVLRIMKFTNLLTTY